MERIIVIRESKNQKKTTIKSNATTLGELKKELDNVGINYEDMTFYEGITKSEFTRDDAQLPHDIIYKGVTTNNLVFSLTQVNKKIKSGAMTRKEMYEFIKTNNLNVKVKEIYGDAMTRVSSVNLSQFIDNYKKKSDYEKVNTEDMNETTYNSNDLPTKTVCKSKEAALDDKFNRYPITDKINILYEITKSNYEINEFELALNKAINKITKNKLETPFSDEELDALFA